MQIKHKIFKGTNGNYKLLGLNGINPTILEGHRVEDVLFISRDNETIREFTGILKMFDPATPLKCIPMNLLNWMMDEPAKHHLVNNYDNDELTITEVVRYTTLDLVEHTWHCEV